MIFSESGDKEITLSILGPGKIFGEIAFLNKAGETRSASARALEETELEVWHPSMLSGEYHEAADGLGVSRKTLSALLNGRFGISPEMAIRLSKAFGGSAESWVTQSKCRPPS
ncbi:MAG: antitoxin HigA [Thermodesulfobacteriota bacterium]|nr:antitoxin HigA [Thermodesulfobacteriota bacterium]